MSKPQSKAEVIPDWRKTNPRYEYSPPVQSADGRVVWLDGGVLYDWWVQDERSKATK